MSQNNYTKLKNINKDVCLDMDIPKNINTYLGSKGYTILKNDISVKVQYFIREQLTVKPFVPGSPVNLNTSFPVYRESDKKLYIPRYYGEELFGLPKEVKINEGKDIDIPFNGSLRDYQMEVVNAYVKKVYPNGGGGLIEIGCGKGKTVCALNVISVLKKKTLVIVHKEFLMNQWIERIQQYLPSAKIGKIQGQIIDVEGKDIVLAMLQSLSMKDYPSSLFENFGLTIIDEVHHISSEVFSCALFKLVTKYMLGLSATMNRKDGTTKVFKMFLGEVVYKDLDKGEHPVIVRGITYETQDDEFNEMVMDFRGNPAFSTMISKLCTYSYRSEFILKLIKDMLEENPKQQIMILAHNKNLLKYLYDAISHRNISSVGYYIGGMKEAALKESESKTVIIATYSMAAEALDIKTLTTLIMATPKTDIEQAVGRILREKHAQPIVVDIIDTHIIFQKQWIKRKKFYKAQNYKIIETTSTNYHPDTSKWTTTYSAGTKKPKVVKEKKNKNVSIKSSSSSNKSVTCDSDIETDEELDYVCETKEDKNAKPTCLLKFKK
jgi:superfamily II DNA or RNA helicase